MEQIQSGQIQAIRENHGRRESQLINKQRRTQFLAKKYQSTDQNLFLKQLTLAKKQSGAKTQMDNVSHLDAPHAVRSAYELTNRSAYT